MTILHRSNLALALLATVLVATWATLAARAQPASDPLGSGLPADSSRFRTGDVDQLAVSRASGFKEFPIAWLGEEFAGYKLTDAFHAVGENQNAFYLIYGSCVPKAEASEPSCVPPLEVVTSAPGTVPPPDDERIAGAGELTSVRGVPARALSGSPFLWTDGVTITIHANGPFVRDAIAGLRSANHREMSFDEVSPGENLRRFGR